jgi:hypothetical protein
MISPILFDPRARGCTRALNLNMGDGAKPVKIFVEYYVEYSDESGPHLAKRMREYRMKKGPRMTATPLHAVDLI